MCKYPFGSGGKRVTTVVCFPLRRSSSMISRMKSSERVASVAVIKSASLQRLRVVRVFAAAVLSLLAISARDQEAAPEPFEPRHVISLGFGLANGGFGVEYFREINEHVALTGGIGATGFG